MTVYLLPPRRVSPCYPASRMLLAGACLFGDMSQHLLGLDWRRHWASMKIMRAGSQLTSLKVSWNKQQPLFIYLPTTFSLINSQRLTS